MCELIVLGDYSGQLTWLVPVLIVVGILASVALLVLAGRTVRGVAVGAALAVLLIAPTVWAFDTLGHAASSTFPEGGPGSLGSRRLRERPGGAADSPAAARVPAAGPGGSPGSAAPAAGGGRSVRRQRGSPVAALRAAPAFGRAARWPPGGIRGGFGGPGGPEASAEMN